METAPGIASLVVAGYLCHYFCVRSLGWISASTPSAWFKIRNPRALYARAAESVGWPHRDSLTMNGWWAMIHSMRTRRHPACTVAGATRGTLDTGPWHRRGLAARNIEQCSTHYMFLCHRNSCSMQAPAVTELVPCIYTYVPPKRATLISVSC